MQLTNKNKSKSWNNTKSIVTAMNTVMCQKDACANIVMFIISIFWMNPFQNTEVEERICFTKMQL